MSAAHGGQVLLSNTTAEQTRRDLPADVTLLDVGEHQLKGLADRDHLWQVVAPGLPQSFPPLQALGTPPSNLPAALDRFVGRKHELEEVEARLAQARLLTLVGTGGSGKTRLALQAAADLREEFEDRVYFVDLASSRDLESALSVTARAIGLREGSTGPLLEELKDQIDGQKMLLLLDNFEQVTVAGPAMAELLRDCLELRQLVTSREPLHVSGENVLPVPPMALPDAEPGHLSVHFLTALLGRCAAVRYSAYLSPRVPPDVD